MPNHQNGEKKLILPNQIDGIEILYLSLRGRV